MRNPNGFGTIKKLSGNRRRSYVFLISKNGKQKPIAYFSDIYEAKTFQLEYANQHNRPLYEPISFAICFHQWRKFHCNNNELSLSTLANYDNAFRHCQNIHNLPLNEIKYYQLQTIIDDMRKNQLSYSSVKKVKSLLNMVFDFAFINDLITKNYAKLINLGKNKPVYPHTIFTRRQINKLWANNEAYADTILILLYTGLRVGELLALEKSNVNLKQKTIKVVKSKTKAGLRIIPIHDKIFSLIVNRYNQSHKYLIEYDHKRLTYSNYRQFFDKITPHTPHDTRHTTATLLDNSGANRNCIRVILGHSGGDVTDSVYTHKGLRQLRKAINLIK